MTIFLRIPVEKETAVYFFSISKLHNFGTKKIHFTPKYPYLFIFKMSSKCGQKQNVLVKMFIMGRHIPFL